MVSGLRSARRMRCARLMLNLIGICRYSRSLTKLWSFMGLVSWSNREGILFGLASRGKMHARFPIQESPTCVDAASQGYIEQ